MSPAQLRLVHRAHRRLRVFSRVIPHEREPPRAIAPALLRNVHVPDVPKLLERLAQILLPQLVRHVIDLHRHQVRDVRPLPSRSRVLAVVALARRSRAVSRRPPIVPVAGVRVSRRVSRRLRVVRAVVRARVVVIAVRHRSTARRRLARRHRTAPHPSIVRVIANYRIPSSCAHLAHRAIVRPFASRGATRATRRARASATSASTTTRRRATRERNADERRDARRRATTRGDASGDATTTRRRD